MGYGGRTFQKEIFLFADDERRKPSLKLTMKGHVRGIPPQERVDITPSKKHISNERDKKHQIVIRGPSDESVQVKVEGPEWLTIRFSKPEQQNIAQMCPISKNYVSQFMWNPSQG